MLLRYWPGNGGWVNLPRSLLGRSLLMILLPLILLEEVALQLFYGSNLDFSSRRLSSAAAG
jgi:two-component system, OmpR family, osmolarity sensor histidine kinase EnvZ